MRFALLVLLVGSSTAYAAPDVSLKKDGTLTAWDAKIKLKLDLPDTGTEDSRVEAITFGDKKGVYVRTVTEGSEDPPDRHRVFLYESGKLKLVYNKVIDTKRIVFAKSGTGRYVESGWGACSREGERKKTTVHFAKKQVITVKLDAKSTKLVETRKPSKEIQDCTQLSACPFVYEVVDGKPQFVGEILRNLRYSSREALQSLWLGEGTGAAIDLTEEKPEITFVDELYLDVDGVRVPPKACVADPSLAYCAADGRYHVMTTGDRLRLEFDAKAGKRNLFARGYYNPMTADE
jgi:hypothetical protein